MLDPSFFPLIPYSKTPHLLQNSWYTIESKKSTSTNQLETNKFLLQ
jgi:hypothetical protein